MTTLIPESRSRSHPSDDSIKASLDLLEEMLDEAADRTFDAEYFDGVEKALRRLHARIRIHHAVDHFGLSAQPPDTPPELVDEVHRLRDEHPVMIGQLDRLIRAAGSMTDRALEDKDVFLLRARELIAFLRRHEAEEDRLFYLSVWRDTGGES